MTSFENSEINQVSRIKKFMDKHPRAISQIECKGIKYVLENHEHQNHPDLQVHIYVHSTGNRVMVPIFNDFNYTPEEFDARANQAIDKEMKEPRNRIGMVRSSTQSNLHMGGI